jgi:hypothetical protein
MNVAENSPVRRCFGTADSIVDSVVVNDVSNKRSHSSAINMSHVLQM